MHLSINSKAQDTTYSNAFVEGWGTALHYSVNYERLIRHKKTLQFAMRIGLSYRPYYSERREPEKSDYMMPISFSLLHNLGGNHFLELRGALLFGAQKRRTLIYYGGSGNSTPTAYYYDPDTYSFLYPGLGFGYRYQPISKGLFVNVLLQNIYIDEVLRPFYPGIGIGYSF